ncbi:hypothetical protein AVEN_184021-1, partial [Araneus ventricosus]
MYNGEVFSSSFENGSGEEAGRQAILDEISRRHKLSYEIKIVEIDLVVMARELSEG